MLNRTTPRRLTFIVLALILGILLGLAFFPSEDLSGAEPGICESVSEIPVIECQALQALYESTDGAGWTENGGWLENASPCSWYGVTCDAGHVWKIDLTGNQLNGPLPAAIGDLGQLQILLLGMNTLTGSIPAQVGQLANLTRLNLSHNQLSGSIPPEITGLGNLRDLSFAYNDLSGEIPGSIGDMSSLQTVEFLSNTLEGPIPTDLGRLPDLGWVDVADNMLTGTIPSDLAYAAELTTLYVKGNQLEGEVPAELCANIIYATVGYNKLDPTSTDPCFQKAVIDRWENTQTLPPANLVADLTGSGSVQLIWTPVQELVDIGYYEVLYATNFDGPYTVHGQTADKQTSSYTISDLALNQDLFFVVRTVTPAHENNQNDLISDTSSVAPTAPTAISLAEFQANQPLPIVALVVGIPLLLLTLILIVRPLLSARLVRRA